MIAGLQKHDVIAGNLANVDTPGFKRDIPITGSFKQEMVKRLKGSEKTGQISSVEIGGLGYGSYVHNVGSDYSQGPSIETQGGLDLAIEGEGFFAVDSPSGELYTRSGAFQLSQSGTLTTVNNMPVLGTEGPVTIPQGTGKVEILADGTILLDGVSHDRLKIISCDDPSLIRKLGNGLFKIPSENVREPRLDSFNIRQGFLEMSNVNSISEMVRMISGMRTYEACQKMVWAIDQTLDKTINDVGRVV